MRVAGRRLHGMPEARRVAVQYACPREGLPEPGRIRRWVRTALAGSRQRAELTVRIVGEAEGAELNQRWRGCPGATNVLSFPVAGLERVAPEALGDVVICAPVAVREAHDQGKPLEAHLAHLVIHGVLHLLGFDHAEDHAARVMEGLETRSLCGLGYPDPYAPAGDP